MNFSAPLSDEKTTSQTPFRKWSMLLVLSLALAIIILDTTILNVALSTIIRDLNTTIQKLQWVITAYSLTLAALTITGGRMGDIFGRKKMFVVGAILFAIGSFTASISKNIGMLIAGEAIIEGIGAALMLPATTSLLVVNFHGRERALAFGVWGGVAGAAAALGPILGGYLTTHFDWRWGFRVNVFVVFLLIIGSVIIPDSRDTKEKPQLDLLGVLLSALGLLTFVFGIIESSSYGWWKATAPFIIHGYALNVPWGLSIVPFCIVIGLGILMLFGLWEVRREATGNTPLVSMKMFTNRMFSTGVLTTTIMSLGQTGLIFSLPVFLQAVRGLNAFDTGLSLLPMSLGLLIFSPLSAVLGKKISPKALICVGLFLNAGAYLILWNTLSPTTTVTDLIPGLALFGIGMGFVMSHISNLTLSSVSVQQAGEASGVNNTLRQVGSTLGSAIIGTVLITSLGSHLVSGVLASSVIPNALKPTIAQAMSSQSSNVEFGEGTQVGTQLPPAIAQEIHEIGERATTEGNKQALLYGAGFAFLGLLMSFFLPSTSKSKKKSHAHIVPEVVSTYPVISSPRQALTTTLLGELIQADEHLQTQGKSGLGYDVRLAIDIAGVGRGLVDSVDQRLLQAHVLWMAGWGKALEMKTFAEYLQSIPVIPSEFQSNDPDFPHLILVDTRVPALTACRLLGIAPKGNEATRDMPHMNEKGGVYWIRCQQGDRYLGKSIDDAERSFASYEQGLSIAEGLALIAQRTDVLYSTYIDLPASKHAGFDESSACLGMWQGNMQMRWRWRDHVDERCHVASRRA